MYIEEYDIKELFDDYGIDYKTSGKNVSAGWIEVNCPFCGDPSYHLGISPTYLIHCWRCGEKGHVIKYLKKILKKNYYEVKSILGKYELGIEDYERKIHPQYKPYTEKFDKGILKYTKKSMPQQAFEYLKSRGFDPNKISSKYKLRFFGYLGDYKFRIFIPVFENRKIVTFTARDYTEKTQVKYLHNKNVPIKNYLYNIDTVYDKVIIVEGVVDVWRMGEEAVATFGIEYTKEQILKLAKKGINKAFVIFDNEEEAQKQATKLAYELSPYCEKVKVVNFYCEDENKKDPAEMFTDAQAQKVKEELFNEE